MAEEKEIHVDHGTVIPGWMKWIGGIAGTAVIGLAVTLVWGLLTGGFDSYVQKQARIVVTAAEMTDDGTTQAAKIQDLTTAVSSLTTAIETSEKRDAEFRLEVRQRLDSLTGAIVELSQ